MHKQTGVKERQTKWTFWNIWTSYATFYFGRVNLSIVVPALLASYQNLNLYNVGLVSSGFFFAYALGQFLHGQISEKFNPFVYIAVGLIGSAVMNFFLGFAGAFFALLFLGELIDGFFQSMGWSSCVRANAMIQKAKQRERSSTILGTCYQTGNSIAWLISAFAVGTWGWRAGFWVAGIFLLARGILLLMTKPKFKAQPLRKMSAQLKYTLNFPIVLAGLALCLLNMVRYGVITWIPLFLFREFDLTIGQMGNVGLKICLIPIAGVLGTLAFNKLKLHRDLLTVIFTSILALSFLVLPMVSGYAIIGFLLLGSFFLYGPHVFLVTTLPSRFVDQKVVAASTGFIDGMGYIGTILVGLIIPFLITTMKGNWDWVFYFWTIISLLAAVIVGTIYFLHFRGKLSEE